MLVCKGLGLCRSINRVVRRQSYGLVNKTAAEFVSCFGVYAKVIELKAPSMPWQGNVFTTINKAACKVRLTLLFKPWSYDWLVVVALINTAACFRQSKARQIEKNSMLVQGWLLHSRTDGVLQCF